MMKEYEELVSSIKKHGINPDFKSEIDERAKTSGIATSDVPYIPFSCIPVFINDEDMEFLNTNTKILHSILFKMTDCYLHDAEYRKLFGFSSDMEKLIMLPCNYEEMFPVMRYDIFLDPRSKNFQLCEINTDGSSGFDIDCKLSDILIDSYKKSRQTYATPQYMDSFHTAEKMADSLIHIYFSSEKPVNKPVFAVVDFTEETGSSDFGAIIDAIQARGYSARFTDVRNLAFNGENLIDTTDGVVIHAIYRRLVTSVVLEKMRDCQNLFEAIRLGKVVIMGHFRTSLAHSKSVFYAMHHLASRKLFNDMELSFINAHIPQTYLLNSKEIDENLLDNILNHRDKWITKPAEGFNSTGVFHGADLDAKSWERLIEERMDKGYIIQKFCPRYPSPTLSCQDTEIVDRYVMMGVFASHGSVIGFYNRAGNEGLIMYATGGVTVPSIRVTKRIV